MLAQEAVKAFQRNFSEGQLRSKKDTYSQICKSHEALFDIPHKHGLLTTMKQDYHSLQASSAHLAQNLSELDTEWIERSTSTVQASGRNFDKIVELVNVPNLLNQCLQ